MISFFQIELGSTNVRVGSTIFGARNIPQKKQSSASTDANSQSTSSSKPDSQSASSSKPDSQSGSSSANQPKGSNESNFCDEVPCNSSEDEVRLERLQLFN